MSKFTKLLLPAATSWAFFVFPAAAAEWVQVSQIGDHLREVDKASIQGQPPLRSFTARHVFADNNEYKIARTPVKYLVMQSKADCGRKTIMRTSVEAYTEASELISRQILTDAQAIVAAPDSIDESVLKYVCEGKVTAN